MLCLVQARDGHHDPAWSKCSGASHVVIRALPVPAGAALPGGAGPHAGAAALHRRHLTQRPGRAPPQGPPAAQRQPGPRAARGGHQLLPGAHQPHDPPAKSNSPPCRLGDSRGYVHPWEGLLQRVLEAGWTCSAGAQRTCYVAGVSGGLPPAGQRRHARLGSDAGITLATYWYVCQHAHVLPRFAAILYLVPTSCFDQDAHAGAH